VEMNKTYDIAVKDGQLIIPSLIKQETSLLEWTQIKVGIREKILNLMGGLPEAVPVKAVIKNIVEEETYQRIHVTYSSYEGDQVTAYLLKPKAYIPGEKYPAIVALHTTAEEGKDVAAGLCGKPGRQYGKELVERGYIVLVPDIFAAGERLPDGEKAYETGFFYAQYPNWSAMGKMLYDHMRGVDFLCSLPEVDSSRIGAIGHSLGGHNAFMLAAFDERVKSTVSSCGLTSIIGDTDVCRWSREEWFVYFKILRESFLQQISPFEFHEILALIAPRAFFNWTAKDDEIFPHWEGVPLIMDRVGEVYRLYRAENYVSLELGKGGHNFPDDIREHSFEFLDKMLFTI